MGKRRKGAIAQSRAAIRSYTSKPKPCSSNVTTTSPTSHGSWLMAAHIVSPCRASYQRLRKQISGLRPGLLQKRTAHFAGAVGRYIGRPDGKIVPQGRESHQRNIAAPLRTLRAHLMPPHSAYRTHIFTKQLSPENKPAGSEASWLRRNDLHTM